jgi:hypothetical protein
MEWALKTIAWKKTNNSPKFNMNTRSDTKKGLDTVIKFSYLFAPSFGAWLLRLAKIS